MKFECNNYNCRYNFELDYTEKDLEKKGLPICPKCKDENTKSYRID